MESVYMVDRRLAAAATVICRGSIVRRIRVVLNSRQIDEALDGNAWRKLHTREDTAVFGIWVSSETRQILSYDEGDLFLTTCPDRRHFNREVIRLFERHQRAPISLAITKGVTTLHFQNPLEFLSMPDTNDAKLEELAESEGMTVDEFVTHFFLKSLVPAICMKDGCGYVESLEPDQDAGWCAECNETSLTSGLILAGLI